MGFYCNKMRNKNKNKKQQQKQQKNKKTCHITRTVLNLQSEIRQWRKIDTSNTCIHENGENGHYILVEYKMSFTQYSLKYLQAHMDANGFSK